MTAEPSALEEYLAFAMELTEEAGKKTLSYFRRSLDVDRKADQSPVTIADRETERFIRESLHERYPEHRIVGEEHGELNPDGSLTWIVDPIDGTKSFIRGVPLYTVLLALVEDDEPLLGVIHCPPQSETVAAAIGLGCTYNGVPCRVTATESLDHALILATDFADLSRRLPTFTDRLMLAGGMTRTWADGYGYLMVATGRADAMMDPIMSVWDIAPLAPVITEAGGVFSDIHGNAHALGDSALAATPAIHRAITALHAP